LAGATPRRILESLLGGEGPAPSAQVVDLPPLVEVFRHLHPQAIGVVFERHAVAWYQVFRLVREQRRFDRRFRYRVAIYALPIGAKVDYRV